MSARPLVRRQSPNNGLAVGGRPIRVPRGVNTVRAMLRRHLREEGRRMQDLAQAWGCKPGNVYDYFCEDRPFSPQHVEACISFLQLDEFDAAELRLQGAREAGWNIDPKYLLELEDG